MSLVYNTIPALSVEFLETMKRVRGDITALKELAYGEDCNCYDSPYPYKPNKPEKNPMTKRDVDDMLSDILSSETLKQISEEQRKLRSVIDRCLIQTVVEKILPQWMPPKALIEYDLYVAGRDMSQIDSKKDTRRGRDDKQEHIKVLPVDEWIDTWEEHIFLDERAYGEEIKCHMPPDNDCLLGTMQRFYAVEKESSHRRKNKNRSNGFLSGYEIVDNKLQVDCRTKSGAELMWKYIPYLTGLEEKPGEMRKDITDMAGIRLICRDDFEQESVDLFQNFMSKYTGDCKGSIKLQILDSNQKKQKKKFFEEINLAYDEQIKKRRNFLKEILKTEDRSHVLKSEDVSNLETKYYLEMLIPFSVIFNNDDCFGRNIINVLSYSLQTFKKIHEQRDPFAYKGRAEDWRDEHYSYLEWRLSEILAPSLLIGDSLRYITHITQSKLHKKSNIFNI